MEDSDGPRSYDCSYWAFCIKGFHFHSSEAAVYGNFIATMAAFKLMHGNSSMFSHVRNLGCAIFECPNRKRLLTLDGTDISRGGRKVGKRFRENRIQVRRILINIYQIPFFFFF